MQKILFSNIGYAKEIDGSLWQHVRRINRHIRCDVTVQQRVLAQLKQVIDGERPDLCCFVEIDSGSFHSAGLNQIESLLDENYPHHDIADKYGERSLLGRLPLLKGKSNGFIAKQPVLYQKHYFRRGTKRLLYQIQLDGFTLFFAHFALQRAARAAQFDELKNLIATAPGEVMVLADFNILQGFTELEPLLRDNTLQVVNREDEFTFTFHRWQLTLDLCLCSAGLAARTQVKVIKQPFSDHAALLAEIGSAP